MVNKEFLHSNAKIEFTHRSRSNHLSTYKVEKYNKRTRFYKEEFVELPNTVSFWANCQIQSVKDKIKVKYVSKPTRSGLNRCVVSAFIDFGDGEVWEYMLVKRKRGKV